MVKIRVNALNAQWVILPPSLLGQAWRSALRDAAARGGASAWEWRSDQDLPDGLGIVLSDDLSVALSAGVPESNVTVIALPPFIDLEGCLTDGEIHARVDAMSRKVASAYAFRGRILYDLTGEISVASLPVFLGSQVVVSQPRSITRREAALQQAANVFVGGKGEWMPGLFTYDDRNVVAGPQSGQLDVTGRPRFLLTGPYMAMPAGTWQAKVSLSFDHDLSHRRFRIDWGGVETFTTYEFCPGRSGMFDIILEFNWETAGPAELRFLVLEGVFHGGVTFGGAFVSRVAGPGTT